MSLKLGQEVTLDFNTFKDALKTQPWDPTALTIDLLAPDGTPTVLHWPTPADVTRVGLGVFTYTFLPSQPGIWGAHPAATGNVTTSDDQTFTVEPEYGLGSGLAPATLTDASGLIRYIDYVRTTKDRASTPQDVVAALNDALQLIQDELQRTLAFGTHTETLYVYRDGKVYPTNTPLHAVTDPPVAAGAIQGAGVYLGTFIVTPPIINTGDWAAAVPPQSTVTYTGGYQPYGTTDGVTKQLPTTLMRAACRVAWLTLHPVALPGVPAGAKSASVGDVALAGDLSSFVAVDPSIARDIKPYRKRPVHAWQSAK